MSERMQVVFFGTPDVAVPSLEALVAADGIDVVAVVTNPDRPRGRSRTPKPPPVKVAAEAAGLPVWQPDRPREILDDLRAAAPDVCAVVAYGALLPADVLEAGGAGFVNLHFSLLPRWRGAAPVQHAIRAGDGRTGVTTFVLDEGMDTGPVLVREEVEIGPDETAGELLDRLAVLGAPVLVGSLRGLVDGSLVPEPQPEAGATLAPKIRREDTAIDFTRPAREVADLVRSAAPAPGAHTTVDGDPLKVFAAEPTDGDGDPGEIVRLDPEGAVVACGEAAVRLTTVQPSGKARMDGAAWVNGYRPEVGQRLGQPTTP